MLTPEEIQRIPIKDYWSYGINVEAVCGGCGRRRIIHAGQLVKFYGNETRMWDDTLMRLAHALVCGHCGQRQPAVRVGQFK